MSLLKNQTKRLWSDFSSKSRLIWDFLAHTFPVEKFDSDTIERELETTIAYDIGVVIFVLYSLCDLQL